MSIFEVLSQRAAILSFRFDEIRTRQNHIRVATDLRAVASYLEVETAQLPEETTGFGMPYYWATTDQIGGDTRYGVGDPVANRWNQPVGKGAYDGALVRVSTQPDSKCRGPLGPADQLQAFWLFSSDACSVYGLPGVRISHAGRDDPAGQITLANDTVDVRLGPGSGMLLRVIQ